MSRHCGMKAPKNIKSDHEFFRIAFKSNDKFDGTGFEAFYQFRPNEGLTHYSTKRLQSFK